MLGRTVHDHYTSRLSYFPVSGSLYKAKSLNPLDLSRFLSDAHKERCSLMVFEK